MCPLLYSRGDRPRPTESLYRLFQKQIDKLHSICLVSCLVLESVRARPAVFWYEYGGYGLRWGSHVSHDPPRRPPSLPWTCEPSAPCRTFGVSSKFHSRNESAGRRASRGCLLASVWRQTKERYQREREQTSRAVRISQFVPFQVRCRYLPSKNCLHVPLTPARMSTSNVGSDLVSAYQTPVQRRAGWICRSPLPTPPCPQKLAPPGPWPLQPPSPWQRLSAVRSDAVFAPNGKETTGLLR